MADAAARREARRKRILDNSQNRLQLISGKSNGELHRESPIRTSLLDQAFENDQNEHSESASRTSLENGAHITEAGPSEIFRHNHDNEAAGDAEIANQPTSFLTSAYPEQANELTSFLSSAYPEPTNNLTDFISTLSEQSPELSSFLACTSREQATEFTSHIQTPELSSYSSSLPRQVQSEYTPFWQMLVKNKYDIIILSILIQIASSLTELSSEETYFFLPLLVYLATKWIWFPTQSNSKLANIVMLLNSLSGNRISTLLQVSQWTSVVLHDAFIYIFTTICIQSLLICAKDYLFT